ncbi:MAG: hypothetical protein ABR915_15625 [Thermoguttaceae bacterium]|jgi:hypothetical protein
MKRLSIILSAIIVLQATGAWAQKPDATATKPAQDASRSARTIHDAGYPTLSPGELQATPEMWFYEQEMRQRLDPGMAVRREAEARAQERIRRIETMRWFGLSNQRPRVSIDPIHGDYAPGWTSNNTFYPYRWVGGGAPYSAARPAY